ncbi:hypothetical protein [Legionella bononiensis]|uniref:Uncharacterized protein n=1 Tax=Legionella bononiensis TaxID=2793102 RepID=A0ABS1WAJ9_9GAMM|nr:hypothetical protein [Legionella bononiensis]MBL7526290.1 hypothetical protein [Legionella bononiensis]
MKCEARNPGSPAKRAPIIPAFGDSFTAFRMTVFSELKTARHPECNEGSPEGGIVPAFGDSFTASRMTVFSELKTARHPECNEGSPEGGIMPAFGDPSLRSG